MPEGIKRPPISFAVDLKFDLGKDAIELLLVVGREQQVGLLGLGPYNHPLEWHHGPCHALTVASSALAAHFNLEDCSSSSFIVHDGHIAIL